MFYVAENIYCKVCHAKLCLAPVVETDKLSIIAWCVNNCIGRRTRYECKIDDWGQKLVLHTLVKTIIESLDRENSKVFIGKVEDEK